MIRDTRFSALELDALCEVANIGCGHAATVLSQMIGTSIMIDVPMLTLEPASEVARYVAKSDQRVVALSMRIMGDLSGETSFVMREGNALVLCDLLLGRPSGSGGLSDPMEQSSLMEAGNVMASGFLNALSVFLNRCLLPSPPKIFYGPVGDLHLSPPADEDGRVLVATTNFRFEDATLSAQHVQGMFLFALDAAARNALFATLRHRGKPGKPR